MIDYQLNSIIGQGTYGIVYNSTYLPTGETFAIKKLYKKFKSVQDYQNQYEIKFLGQYQHKNIINIKEIFLEKEELFLVFEYMDQNLYQFYYNYKKNKKQIPESVISKIIQQILQGISFMHSVGYFHRDLKPENILISKEQIKICDFGQVKPINSKPPFTEYMATRWYRSPEQILLQGNYNHPVDIFAIGAIMAELYNQKPIFQGKSQIDQINQICNILGNPEQKYLQENNDFLAQIQIPKIKPVPLENIILGACPEAIDLLNQIFQFNPDCRPSAQQLLDHEYFKKFQKQDETNKSKTMFKITIKQKQQAQDIQEEYLEDQIKLLSMSLEPKHKQLIQYKNNIEKNKKNIFQQEVPNNFINISNSNSNLYNSKIFAFKQNIINKDKPNLVLPKIMNKKKNY